MFSQNTNPADRRSFRQPLDRLPSNTLLTTRNIMREQGRERKRQKLKPGERNQKYRNEETSRKIITKRRKHRKRKEVLQEQNIHTSRHAYKHVDIIYAVCTCVCVHQNLQAGSWPSPGVLAVVLRRDHRWPGLYPPWYCSTPATSHTCSKPATSIYLFNLVCTQLLNAFCHEHTHLS